MMPLAFVLCFFSLFLINTAIIKYSPPAIVPTFNSNVHPFIGKQSTWNTKKHRKCIGWASLPWIWKLFYGFLLRFYMFYLVNFHQHRFILSDSWMQNSLSSGRLQLMQTQIQTHMHVGWSLTWSDPKRNVVCSIWLEKQAITPKCTSDRCTGVSMIASLMLHFVINDTFYLNKWNLMMFPW